MVKLRLKRIGRKGMPFYRIVAIDSKKARNGSYLELIGTYDGLKKIVNIDHEKALKWLKIGAQPTDVVKSLLSKQGINKCFHEHKYRIKSSSSE